MPVDRPGLGRDHVTCSYCSRGQPLKMPAQLELPGGQDPYPGTGGAGFGFYRRIRPANQFFGHSERLLNMSRLTKPLQDSIKHLSKEKHGQITPLNDKSMNCTNCVIKGGSILQRLKRGNP